MQAAEPNPEDVRDQQAPDAGEQEAWRAEVASRVSSYRAKRRRTPPAPPALDFGPEPERQPVEGDANWRPIEPLPGARKAASAAATPAASTTPGDPAWRPIVPAHIAPGARKPFDTEYYRRLNAENFQPPAPPQASGPMAQGSSALAHAAPEMAPQLDAVVAPQVDAQLPDLELRPAAASDDALDRYILREPEAAPLPEPAPLAAPVQSAAAPQPDNLIIFRRPLIEPPLAPTPAHDELAEPMNSRPRILEVPEDIMPPVQQSLFPEIQLDAIDLNDPTPRQPELKLPLAVATVGERLEAGLMDLGIVLAAGVIFSAMAWMALPDVPHAKPFFLALAAVPVLFWTIYQHLFLLYAGRTPGMVYKRIRLANLDGVMPSWHERSNRAHFMFLSMASVLLGFVWAAVDEDALCWHDRISHTFPTAE